MMQTHQSSLTPLNIEEAEPAAQKVLEAANANLGFVPNMYGAMANLPALLLSYIDSYNQFRQGSELTPVEQEVVLLVISVHNECSYCVAAHSFVADAMSKVPTEVTDAIRSNSPIQDPKLAALATFTSQMLETQGRPGSDDTTAFLAAGYDERHVLSVILALSVKTISNYTNHFFHTEVDSVFESRAWVAPEAVNA